MRDEETSLRSSHSKEWEALVGILENHCVSCYKPNCSRVSYVVLCLMNKWILGLLWPKREKEGSWRASRKAVLRNAVMSETFLSVWTYSSLYVLCA